MMNFQLLQGLGSCFQQMLGKNDEHLLQLSANNAKAICNHHVESHEKCLVLGSTFE